MPCELQSLSDLYQNRLFRIPDYQRGYAWKHQQLTDFWEDVLNLHQGKNHYTGLISLRAVSPNEVRKWTSDYWLLEIGFRPFHVVDGQQRLATFSIFINEIVSLVQRLECNHNIEDRDIFLRYESLEEIKRKYIYRKCPCQDIITTYLFGYNRDNPTYDYLRYQIFEEPHGGAMTETYYTKNLRHAKKFFADNIASLYNVSGLDAINNIYNKLTTRLLFNLNEIDNDYDVYVAFETMNNRGKKLTNLELLKNRLIYITTLFDDDKIDTRNRDALRAIINDAWKEIYYQIGRNQMLSLSDDDFLRNHWIAYFQYSRKKKDEYIHFLLNKFSARNVFDQVVVNNDDEVSDIVQEEYEDITEEGYTEDVYEAEILTHNTLQPKEIVDYVQSLKDFAEYWYYTYFPNDSDYLLLEEKVWIEKLNRVSMGYFRPLVAAVIARSKCINDNHDDSIDLLKEIERFIFLAFRVGKFHASYKSSYFLRKIRSILRRETELKTVTEDIKEIIKKDLSSIVRNFVTQTKRRFESGQGFYEWSGIRYFLYEYEYSLSLNYGIERLDWRMFSRSDKDKVTIEHILPQNPTEPYWVHQFKDYTESQVSALSSSLGNLLPLAQSINSSLQNVSFIKKKQPDNTNRRGYSNGSHSEIEVAAEENWTANAILERGYKLIEFMLKRWDFDLNESELIQILYPDPVWEGDHVTQDALQKLAILTVQNNA